MQILINEGDFRIIQIAGDLKTLDDCARTCYQSRRKTPEDVESFLRNLLTVRKHESVFEHSLMTVEFNNVSRGFSHEMVRHRLASFSQESTRYVDPHKGAYKVVMPEGKDLDKHHHTLINGNTNVNLSVKEFLKIQEQMYTNLLEDGWKKEDARQILPIGIKSQIVVSANFREWRHIFNLRTSDYAHWEIRGVMRKLLVEARKQVPIMFDDCGSLGKEETKAYEIPTTLGNIGFKVADSSNISGYTWTSTPYFGITKELSSIGIGVLIIHFKSGGVYVYSNVPEQVYNSLEKAESKGKFFNKFIKPNPELFPFKRINVS